MNADRDERFLITGADGCIGSWVVRQLLDAGLTVVACDLAPEPLRIRRITDPGLLAGATYLPLDLTTPGAVEELVARHRVTRIVHLAALQVPFVAANPVLGAEVNVVGTLRVLEAARRSHTVRGLSYASSSAVFGSSAGWGRPDTLYGVLKTCNEESARFYARDYATPSVGLRPCVVYGPNRDRGLSAAVTHALKAVVLDQPYTIPFSGLIDLQYVEDVAAAFIGAALAEQHERADVYDLHGDLVEVAEIVTVLEREAAAVGCIAVGSDPVPGRVEFDDAPLRAAVADLPRTPLAEGIRSSLEIFRRQRHSGALTVEGFREDAGIAARQGSI